LAIGYDQIGHSRLTHVGIRRSHNQDSSAVLLAADLEQWRQHGHVFMVADGMGGHAVGELASELASSIIPHTYHKYSGEGPGPALRKAFQEANASIHSRGQQNQEFAGMGTTSTTLLLRPEGAWIGHVGDSRVYRIRGQRIQQLSFDHSWVWEMARRQGVAPEDLVSEHRNNVIVRSLGPDPDVEVDIEGPHPVRRDDIYLICSDGLSGPVSDEEMGAVATVLPPDEACRFLVHLANLRGGPDNITVVVVRIGDASQHEMGNSKSEIRNGNHEATRRTFGFRFPNFAFLGMRRVSWTIVLLIVGLISAAGAVNLASDAIGRKASTKMAASVVLFVLAIGALSAGSMGLILNYYRHKRVASDHEESPGLHVYHEADCHVDRPLVDRLIEAEKTLAQEIRDNNWEVDWEANAGHRHLGEQAVQEKNLSVAFREYCRALLPLTDTLERYRNKEEIFQPLWDKVKKD
jgi:protein phosphatase